jgi:hypothetical protein
VASIFVCILVILGQNKLLEASVFSTNINALDLDEVEKEVTEPDQESTTNGLLKDLFTTTTGKTGKKYYNLNCSLSDLFTEKKGDGAIRCPSCPTSLSQAYDQEVGNLICNSSLNTAQCCYDGGDCDKTNTDGGGLANGQGLDGDCNIGNFTQFVNDLICDVAYLSCNATRPMEINDCVTLEHWNKAMGLCQACGDLVASSEDIGNGQCNAIGNHEDCCYDAGDCEGSMSCLSLAHLNVDGICDDAAVADACEYMIDCSIVGGSLCPTCNASNYERIFMGDSVCHSFLDTKECCFDELDCTKSFGYVQVNCPSCSTNGTHLSLDSLDDGYCDSNLNTKECCMDGGDCNDLLTRGFCTTCNRVKSDVPKLSKHFTFVLFICKTKSRLRRRHCGLARHFKTDPTESVALCFGYAKTLF